MLLLYKNTNHNVCHHIFMYKRRDKNTNFYVVHIAQTKFSIEYISNIYGSMMQSEKKIVSN